MNNIKTLTVPYILLIYTDEAVVEAAVVVREAAEVEAVQNKRAWKHEATTVTVSTVLISTHQQQFCVTLFVSIEASYGCCVVML